MEDGVMTINCWIANGTLPSAGGLLFYAADFGLIILNSCEKALQQHYESTASIKHKLDFYTI